MGYVIRQPSLQAPDMLRKLIQVCLLPGAESDWWLISFSVPLSFLISTQAILPPAFCWLWIPAAVATLIVAFRSGAPVVGYQCTWVGQLGVLGDVQRASAVDFHLLSVESRVEIWPWWKFNPIPTRVTGEHTVLPGTLPQISQERLELQTWNFLTI